MLNFLDDMNLKGRASLARTKLIELLSEANNTFGEDQKVIIEEYDGWTDKEKGQFKADNSEMNKVLNELANQEIKISFVSPFKNDFVKSIKEYNDSISGQSAEAYAELYKRLVVKNEEEEK